MNAAAKMTLAALAATAGLAAAAAPAAAQDWRYDRPGYGYDYGYARYDRGDYNIDARQARLNDRIEDGVRDGSITWREARELREQSRDIARVEARYRYDGLNGWERADLDRRLDRLDQQIRYERRDGDYRRW
jgi:opacity protein-like surface antigen